MTPKYPNPLSDVPKINGDTIHVRNQSENDIDGTLVLISQPVKGPGKKAKRLRRVGLAIKAIGVVLLLSMAAMAVQQVWAWHNERVIRQLKEESIREMHERHKSARP